MLNAAVILSGLLVAAVIVVMRELSIAVALAAAYACRTLDRERYAADTWRSRHRWFSSRYGCPAALRDDALSSVWFPRSERL